jgi:DNA-binding helix-hairpin-helix protein with protein kinase domain
MFKQSLIDRSGKPIVLGNELGRGGEGTVFEIHGKKNLVAKLYLNQPDQEKADKILGMVSAGNERLLRLAAWPLDSIHSRTGNLLGFSMQKLEGYRPLFELYSPKLRLKEFPRADWRFLIHAAMNVARAFAVIHEAGHVIGDVNHGNLLVAKDATVKFIDTDSFQISVNGHHWLCEVGVSTHQPPEMQGRSSYKGIIRTSNQDNFGLAVLIFQLLCLARHPFSGRFLGHGDMPIEKAISEFRFAYSSDHRTTQMKPPPASISMSGLTPKIVHFFEKAFSKDGIRNGGRPTANEWISALEELVSKLKVCKFNQGHHFLSSLTTCPWCDIEVKSSFTLFPVIMQASQTTVNISLLWLQVIGLHGPGPEPSLPELTSVNALPSEESLNIGKRLSAKRNQAYILFSLMLAAAWTLIPHPLTFLVLLPCMGIWQCLAYKKIKREATNKIMAELSLAKSNWDDISSNWSSLTSGSSFTAAKQQLEVLKQKYDALQQERQHHLRNLWSHHSQQQLIEHLDRYRIDSAGLEGFGAGRISTLQSYGIETAADIERHRLMAIGGFGLKLTQRLVDWRRQCEGHFKFDPSKGNTQAIVASIDRDIGIKRRKIEQELVIGVARLTEIRAQIERSRQTLLAQASILLKPYAQAVANAKAVG